MSGDPAGKRTSLFGPVSFRPRLVLVLILLTLTVAVVGYHISRDSGVRRVESIGQDALRIFSAAKNERTRATPPRDPVEVEERIQGWIGAKVALPRDEKLFSYKAATRERVGKRSAAAVRFSCAGETYLLMVLLPETLRGPEAPSPRFSGSSFLSWAKEGISFVFWERDGVQYMLVSDVDLTRTFELVRQYFT